MDELKAAATRFQELLNVQYKIVLVKKGKLYEFRLAFNKEEFFHLIGLQYLKDIPQLKRNRSTVFDMIINEKITLQTLQKSSFYGDISERIKDFLSFENILDRNDIIFKYSKNRSSFSNISAEYMLKTPHQNKINYIFIDSSPDKEEKFCKSFFCNNVNDYTQNQITMTLLYKEKIYLDNGRSIIQFNKLQSK